MMKSVFLLNSLFFLLVLVGGVNKAIAQTASVTGIITEFTSGEALQGANITLKEQVENGAFLGASSDKDGLYSIQKIKPGDYELKVSFLGYAEYVEQITISADDKLNKSIALKFDDLSMGEVVVSHKSSAAVVERGAQRITAAQISRVPTPVAGGDLVSYLQTMPGVISLGNRGGQVFIRGGTPSENMVLVDGALVYKPFHILSFFSPFPDNLVASADFYPGGFGAEYSGRLSSVLDIEMKHGDRFKYSGSGSISPFMGGVLVQGPVKKGQKSFIFSSKTSVIDQTSQVYMSEDQPMNFGSQFLKFSNITDNTQCSGMMLRTADKGKVDTDSDETVEWKNFVLSGKCEAVNNNLFVEFNSSISNMQNTSVYTDRTYSSDITQFYTSFKLSGYKGKTRFDFGMFWRVEWLEYDLSGRVNGLENKVDDPMSTGAFITLTMPITDNLSIEPGLSLTRYVWYPVSFEPRVRINWTPFGEGGGELSGAAGIYRQMILGFTDQRDATGVFVTWTQSPFEDKVAEARHALLGWQQTVGGNFNYSVEVFYKKIYDSPITVWNTVAKFTTDLALAEGDVYGVDTKIDYTNNGWYGLLSYGYTKVEYSSSQDHFGVWFGNPVVSFNPAHDRRHQMNALVSKTIKKFTAGARWQYGSGIPFTQPLGFDEIVWFDNGLPDVREELGTTRMLIDKPFSGRFPAYHSLDVSVEQEFDLKGADLAVKFGALNVYNRANIFYYDLYTQKRVDQLPFTAYISLKLDV